ncbi:MAG: Valine-tRNA ligase [Candidatus Peregrinibacteria bacterium GW2011_GWA2_47_7]|nr:MAG: Valine-tRNA ligase [Candidatus Peregrinibacteria bacterium GW2011_GWA2_47_7]
MADIAKAYNPEEHEDAIYKQWEDHGSFKPQKTKDAKPFTISIPPPNATGTLHLGHAIMLALEDIMIRYHRMRGDAALWVPGTDHAGIATQNKVEKLLAEKGKTRHDLGREAFIKEVEQFVIGSQETIHKQIRKMGASVDWSRERFTLDSGLSRAVQEIFVRMYEDGIIYRGNRIVNWCPRCSSTLADDEVNYKEEHTKFYYIHYGPVVIGTARPETKFLDKVIVVHPDDERYKKYHGKSMDIPWINGTVTATFIADPSADPEFGSGAMTITPAHSFVDFEIAQRNGIDVIPIINEDGTLNENAGEFAGQNAHSARSQIVKKMQEKGLIEKIDENYFHNLSVCYRCDTPIEPLVSKQWFVAVTKEFPFKKSRAKARCRHEEHAALHQTIPELKEGEQVTLKKVMRHVVESGAISILPDRFNKTYFHWIDNLRDWCISRQIWYGHRIPVWYCVGDGQCKIECKQPIVQTTPPEKCFHCGSKNLAQDPDTLDTWFSSGIWTFSTLGWPDETEDLAYFHPTSVLETGYDILFFWVARMILMTTYALGEIPFKTVYLHGLVRTRTGEKMSKSKPETCIDPLDMIEKYGTDALRLSMIVGSGPGNDVRLYEEKIAGYRNFVNKIWNAARFALLNISDEDLEKPFPRDMQPTMAKTRADKWILTRTQELISSVTDALEKFQFSSAGTAIYEFTWGEYCAWYLEFSKGSHKNTTVLLYVLKNILKMLHPFVPFVTETLWSELKEKNLLIGEPWPTAEKDLLFEKEAQEMQTVIDVIGTIRSLRHESGIEPAELVPAIVYLPAALMDIFTEKSESIIKLCRLKNLEIHERKGVKKKHTVKQALSQYLGIGIEIFLPITGILDIEGEKKRIEKEIENIVAYLASLDKKLANPDFIKKAPAELVAEQKEKQAIEQEKLKQLEGKLDQLKG